MQRLAIVQQAIGDRGWSLQVKRELMEELGVSASTVQEYRVRLINGMRVELDERTREERQAEFLERLQGHQRAALASGKMGPLAAMLNSVQVVLNVPDVKKEDK